MMALVAIMDGSHGIAIIDGNRSHGWWLVVGGWLVAVVAMVAIVDGMSPSPFN